MESLLLFVASFIIGYLVARYDIGSYISSKFKKKSQ